MGILEELLRKKDVSYQTPEYLDDPEIQSDDLARTYDQELANARNYKASPNEFLSGALKGLGNIFKVRGGINNTEDPFAHVDQARRESVEDVEKRIKQYRLASGDSDEARQRRVLLMAAEEKKKQDEERRKAFLASAKKSLGYDLDPNLSDDNAYQITKILEDRARNKEEDALKLEIARVTAQNQIARDQAKATNFGVAKPLSTGQQKSMRDVAKEINSVGELWDNLDWLEKYYAGSDVPYIGEDNLPKKGKHQDVVGSNAPGIDFLQRKYNSLSGDSLGKELESRQVGVQNVLQKIRSGLVLNPAEIENIGKETGTGTLGTTSQRKSAVERNRKVIANSISNYIAALDDGSRAALLSDMSEVQKTKLANMLGLAGYKEEEIASIIFPESAFSGYGFGDDLRITKKTTPSKRQQEIEQLKRELGEK